MGTTASVKFCCLYALYKELLKVYMALVLHTNAWKQKVCC